MNCYGGKELASSFRTVRKNTLAIAHDIPEDKYSFRPAEGCRTVAELLTHIAISYRFQYQVHAEEKRSTLAGFDFGGVMAKRMAEEKEPRTKAQIVALLESTGEKWASWAEGLSDEFLAERVEMPTPPGGAQTFRTRFDMILSVKEHEMHHRGQLMLVERMIGIVPHLTREMQARMASMAAARK